MALKKEERTYKNSILPVADFERELTDISRSISSDEESEELEELSLEHYMNKELHEAVVEFKERATDTLEWDHLENHQRRFVDYIINNSQI